MNSLESWKTPKPETAAVALLGAIAIGLGWYHFQNQQISNPVEPEPKKEPEKALTKREEFLRQKPLAPLDLFIKRRHEKILGARPIQKKKQPKKASSSSSEDDTALYRMDPSVLAQNTSKTLYQGYSYTSEEVHVMQEEDRDQPYARNGYQGYSSFQPIPDADKEYFLDKANSQINRKDDHRLSNWNRRFRHCLKAIQELEPTSAVVPRIEANLNLMHLAQDFIYAATSYGKIIISEYYLPLNDKTIKPCKLGGLLGGQKYIVQNILFKFAVDYNGLFGSDYSAAKVAGNELRGLISYYNCHLEKLHVPLMALVDYRGFRLIAMSILPVGNDTIIYGSCDAGRTVHATDPELNALMALAAEKQNLKAHECRIARQDSYKTQAEYQQRKREIFSKAYDEPRVIHTINFGFAPEPSMSSSLYDPQALLGSSDEEDLLMQQDINSEEDANELQFPELGVELNPVRRASSSGSHTMHPDIDMNAARRSSSGKHEGSSSSGRGDMPATHFSSSGSKKDKDSIFMSGSKDSGKKVSINPVVDSSPKRSVSSPETLPPKSVLRKSGSNQLSPHHSWGSSTFHSRSQQQRFSDGYENQDLMGHTSYANASSDHHRKSSESSEEETSSSEGLDSHQSEGLGDGYDARFEFTTAPKKQRESLTNPSQKLTYEQTQKGDHEDDTFWDHTELLYSPADLEGHKGRDHRFYLLDFSRTQPPEKPNPNFKNAHLSQLLRPEFLQEYHKPLCPDAYSGFIRGTTEESSLNKEIEEATKYLHTILIPKFAKELNEKSLPEAEKAGQLASFPLTEAAHRYGINCRHFGKLRNLIPTAQYKTFILGEIVARCIKNNLRWKLREKMKQIALPLEEPYRRLIITYLNLVFGNSRESDRYWNEWLKRDCSLNYADSLTAEEMLSCFQLKLRKPDGHGNFLIDTEFLSWLFRRVTYVMGMQFGTAREPAFLNPDPFDDTDLEQIAERVKHMNIISHARGYFYHVKGLANRIDDNEAAQRFYALAIAKYEEALNSDPNNKEILLSIALTWCLMIEDGKTGYTKENVQVQKAWEYSLRAIHAEPKYDAFSCFRFAQFLEKMGELDTATDYFLMALEVDPNNAGCLHCYGLLLSARGYHDEAELFFKRASQNTVGFTQWPQWYH